MRASYAALKAPVLPDMALPPEDDAPALIAFMNAAASLSWAFSNIARRLDALTETEREACPDFVALRADAIAGMEHVAAKQRAARQRLEAINAFPTRWTAWPERRRFPRPEL